MVFGIDTSGVFGGIMTFLLALFGIIIVGGVIAFIIFYYMRVKRYKQFSVTMFRKDAFGQITRNTEGAGIWNDKKTMKTRLFFQRGGSMDADKVPFMWDGKRKCIFVLFLGGGNFKFVMPNFSNDDVKYEVGLESKNWAVYEYAKSVQILQKQSLWEKILPFAALALVSIIILFMFIFLFRKFDVIQQAAQSLSEAANTLKDIQMNMTLARAGGVV